MGKKWGWAILTAIMLAICALGLAEGDGEDVQSLSEVVITEQGASVESDAAETDAAVIEQDVSGESDTAEDDATVMTLNTFSACEHPNREHNGRGTQKNQTVVDNGNGTHTRSFDVYHFYVCTTCGDVEERFIERGTEIEEHVFRGDGNACIVCGAKKPCEHSWSDGVCTKCGEACKHPNREHNGRGTQKNQTVVDNGNGTHTRSFDVYHFYVCTTCGDVEDRYMERGEETEEHVFRGDGNACIVCGAKKPCEHVWNDGVCTKCGEACKHTWNDGVCAACGYVCKHPEDMRTLNESKTEREVLESRSENEKTHTDHCLVSAVYDCACGAEYMEEYIEDISGQPHSWKDGACTDCGYVCQHPQSMLTYSEEKSWEEGRPSVAENEKTHTDHYVVHDVFDCACGKEFMPPAVEKSVSGKPHTWSDGVCTACGYACGHSWSDGVCANCGYACEHSWSDGKCIDCGYACQHPENMLTLNESKSQKEVLESRAENGKTHTDHCLVSDVYDCACGGEYTEEYIEDIPGQPHTWNDGVCAACSYACAHEELEADGEPVRTDGALVYIDQNTHAQSFTLTYSMKCACCGVPAGTMTGSGRDAAVAHAYHNNVCACGAVEYVPEDDNNHNHTGNGNNTVNRPVQPVEQPEDEDEDLVITEPPRASMVETLVDTVAKAEASGSDVKVEIVGAEQAMTAEEYTQLQTLPVQEQVLVTLASIGFEDVVTAAMQTMDNVQLSDDAQNLMDSVTARTAAATPEERRQMEAKLEQYFPKREIEVNGVTYPYFVMELQIEVDGKLSVVRYGFRMDDKGEWIFMMLDQI